VIVDNYLFEFDVIQYEFIKILKAEEVSMTLGCVSVPCIEARSLMEYGFSFAEYLQML